MLRREINNYVKQELNEIGSDTPVNGGKFILILLL